MRHLGLIVPVERAHGGKQAVRPAVQFDGAARDARERPRRCSMSTARDIRRLAGGQTQLAAGRRSRMTRRQHNMLFPTTLVGSYPQPDWLIDREKLAGRFPPRVRARELWRVPQHWLAQAQDDATVLAIRAQEQAGLDIITDGEIRRESYSNRFATALEGVDIDNPGTALDRSGHPNPVPRVVGPIRRKHAGAGRRSAVPRSGTRSARSRSPCPGRSRWRSRRRSITTTAAASSPRSTMRRR